jgi:hypothetical protein
MPPRALAWPVQKAGHRRAQGAQHPQRCREAPPVLGTLGAQGPALYSRQTRKQVRFTPQMGQGDDDVVCDGEGETTWQYL